MRNHKVFLLLIIGFVFTGWSQNYTPHHYQQNDWFLDYGENTAQYVNPASIAENDQIEIAIGIFTTISGKAGQELVAGVHPFGLNHSVGFTIFENGSRLETKEGESFPAYVENAYQLGYAYRFGQNMFGSHEWAIGANLSVIQFDLFTLKQFFSMGMDLGITYNPISTSKFGHWQFGLAIQNLRQPKVEFAQDDASTPAQNYAIPMNLNPSIFWRGFNRRLEIAASYSVVNIVPKAKDVFNAIPKQIIDAEEAVGSMKFLPSVRAIFYMGPMVGLKAKYSKQGYPIVGATINMRRVNLFRYLQLDVDLSHDQITATNEGRGFAFNIKAITRVGPTREERIGARRYARLKLEPENLYREAMRLYLARKFFDAAQKFGEVVTKYPAFHLVDQAAFYKGKSFENLRGHAAAKAVYNNAIKKYADSDVKPRYIFQLMNIDYKEKNYSAASEKYNLISELYADSDVKPDADYVMGQIRFLEGDYSNSIRLLQPILPGNGNFVYARYTLAMCYYRQKNTDEAIAALKEILEVSPSNISEQELQDVAKVKLGHFAFDSEPPKMAEAAQFYMSVPPTSTKYDEALLGLAWALLRGGKYPEAKGAADALISSAPESFLVGEAYLLRGYCEFFAKNYSASNRSLDLAIEKSNAQAIAPDEVSRRRSDAAGMQDKFVEVQKKSLNLSNQLPSARRQQSLDILRPKFDEVHEAHEQYMTFLKKVGESNRFENNRARVVKDAKFTKATVTNYLEQQQKESGPSIEELEKLELE